MGERIGLGIVGIGKIARDQHLPALAASQRFTLLAGASRNASLAPQPTFESLERMMAATPAMQAVTLCTPPAVRLALARTAIAAGLHVMLEKPPGKTLSEVSDLQQRAAGAGVSLFATWHSRQAACVATARQWLAPRRIEQVRIHWQEDVRVWHPRQEWLWQAGGLGVFDPGINALSIITRVLPERLVVDSATLWFPANRDAPIAADLNLLHGTDPCVTARFDFRHTGEERWDIEVRTDAGRLLLSQGGHRLRIDDEPIAVAHVAKYASLYEQFARLIAAGDSDVGLDPLQLVADAFLCGRRVLTAPFDW